MAINQLHGLYAVELGEGTPVAIPGIQALTVSSNTSVRGEVTDGQVEPGFQNIVAQQPGITFGTLAVGTALSKFGLQGFIVNVAGVPTGLNAFARKHALGATRDAGATHRRYRMVTGMIVPRTLTCEHGGDASLPFDALPIYDGTNAPIIVTDAVSIPGTLLTGFDERYTIGKIKINGTVITSVRSVQIDFAVGAVLESADGDVWPTFVNVREVNPVITISGIDVDWLRDTAGAGGAVATLGEALLQSNTEIYFRKRKDSTTFELDTAGVHLHFVVAGVATVDPFIDTSGSEASEVTITITARRDPPNSPIKFNIGAIA